MTRAGVFSRSKYATHMALLSMLPCCGRKMEDHQRHPQQPSHQALCRGNLCYRDLCLLRCSSLSPDLLSRSRRYFSAKRLLQSLFQHCLIGSLWSHIRVFPKVTNELSENYSGTARNYSNLLLAVGMRYVVLLYLSCRTCLLTLLPDWRNAIRGTLFQRPKDDTPYA